MLQSQVQFHHDYGNNKSMGTGGSDKVTLCCGCQKHAPSTAARRSLKATCLSHEPHAPTCAKLDMRQLKRKPPNDTLAVNSAVSVYGVTVSDDE